MIRSVGLQGCGKLGMGFLRFRRERTGDKRMQMSERIGQTSRENEVQTGEEENIHHHINIQSIQEDDVDHLSVIIILKNKPFLFLNISPQ